MEQKNIALLKRGIEEVGATATDDAISKLAHFYDLVTEANSRFNLTAIVDEEDFVVKHFVDSASSSPLIGKGARLLDVGSGAGFPAIPLAILRDDISVVALDATEKKARFIAECGHALYLNNLSAKVGRAEEQKDMFSTFDVVTARAVAPLNILMELCSPFLKVGGTFVAYKADDGEVKLAQNASQVLKMTLFDVKKFTLPNGDGRALIVYKKEGATPSKYPRRFGAIKKSPL